jgi:hypothetical protein
MKKMILLTLLLALLALAGYSQNLNKSALCKKWYIHHYTYMWVDYDPEEKEKDDFLLFNENMTYVNVDEGTQTTGRWSFDAREKSLQLFGDKGNNLKLLIKDLDEDKLIFKIDKVELKGASFHYTSSKRQLK